MFSGYLAHDLHQSPTHAARPGFGRAYLSHSIKGRDILSEEGGFVADGPGIPVGFLLDYCADESGVELMLRGFEFGCGDDFLLFHKV